MVYGGPQMTYATDEAEIRYGVRAVDPGTYAFHGLGEQDLLDVPPELPAAKDAATLTPVEFLDRIHKAGWGLSYLLRNLPMHRRQLADFAAEDPEAMPIFGLYMQARIVRLAVVPDVMAKLDEALRQVQDVASLTAGIFGAEWLSTLAAPPSPPIRSDRGTVIVRAVERAGAEAVQSWSGFVAKAIQAGFAAINAEMDVREDEEAAELAFWERIYDMTVGLFMLPIDGLKALIRGLIDALGDLGAAAGESLAKALWKIVKPLLIPAALLGGGYVAYRVYQRRRRAALRQAPPRTPPLPPGGR